MSAQPPLCNWAQLVPEPIGTAYALQRIPDGLWYHSGTTPHNRWRKVASAFADQATLLRARTADIKVCFPWPRRERDFTAADYTLFEVQLVVVAEERD